ncbi:permease prefix domain 1-containing protein [Microbacterium ulmi]|uniref:Uncharacterized protein n=1 Tax=Microbacterium ulmi TaxID=179095 RepID=A0A7Y2M2Q2_9MICO|nr:permease prefix domain 1-containing protein [Microbacterium ulmi]NII68783.1 large-conductance mechanosensitive channel [Microbacterium ulmi]NNH05390.1 hypothetical protein [Microbacterium ulmi]
MNATTTLTDRYVLAVVRAVPEKQRDDVAAELRASIADQIDARVDDGQPQDAAERAVLTELGDPAKLAAGYADRPLHLIGPAFYLDWRRLLKLLLAIVPACAAFGVALGQVLAGASFGEVVGTVVSVVIGVIVHLAFWVTVVFAILERTGVKRPDMGMSSWTPDQLPEPRDRGTGFGDLIASIVFLLVAAGAILWDHLLGAACLGGEWISFLDPGLWPWWIGALFVAMAIEAVFAILVYARRGWTWGLAIANTVLDVVVALPALWLLWDERLVNPGFVTALESVGADIGEAVTVLTVIVGFVIVGVAVWDSVDGFLKARRAR